MLHQRFSPDDIGTLLVPTASFTPYPRADDRTAWETLPADTRRELVEDGEEFLGFAYPALPATLFLEFAREGNRSRYETQHFARRAALESLVVAAGAPPRRVEPFTPTHPVPHPSSIASRPSMRSGKGPLGPPGDDEVRWSMRERYSKPVAGAKGPRAVVCHPRCAVPHTPPARFATGCTQARG